MFPVVHSFSIIVPTIGRHALLARLLSSIARQRHPVLEVIIVDQSPAAVDIKELLAALSAGAMTPRLRYVHAPQIRGAAEARNYGALIAGGEILLFLDDDVTIDEDFVYWLARAFEDRTVAGAAGMINDANGRRPSAIYRFFFQLFYVGEFRQRRQEIWWSNHKGLALTNTLPGVVAYRKSIWSEYRFDEALTGHSLGEDIDLSYRVGKKRKLVIDTRAHCLHYSAPAPYKRERRVMTAIIAFYHYHFRKNMRGTPLQWFQFAWINVGYLLFTIAQCDHDRLLGLGDGWREIMRRGVAYRPKPEQVPARADH